MKDLEYYRREYLEYFKHHPYHRNIFKVGKEDIQDSLNEECGVFGLFSDTSDTFSLSQFGLFA